MAVHACLMAFIAAMSLGGASDASLEIDGLSLIAGDPVLADVNQLEVVLATRENPGVEQLIDVVKLKAQVWQKLRDAGVRPLEENSESTQRLLVHVEGIEMPDCGKYVYRVQTALCRLVIVPGQENRRVQVEVWRVRPVLAAADKAQAGGAICAAVLSQAEFFTAARKAARSLPDATKNAAKDPLVKSVVNQMTPQAAGSESAYPFVASKSGNVFHRSDCRWAQNISGDNRIGYKTREEAIQAGKRPCKSCKP
ncbi:MAG: hypothetical protein ABFE01_05550 [Phycisphaerales bacterium]